MFVIPHVVVAFAGGPVYTYDETHVRARAAQIETRCNVPVHLEVRAGDVLPALDPSMGKPGAYPPVHARDCAVDALRAALQASLDRVPCTYRVTADLGGLVVSPTVLQDGRCVVAPSRLDELLPMWDDPRGYLEALVDEGLAASALTVCLGVCLGEPGPREPTTVREDLVAWLSAPDPYSPPDGRRKRSYLAEPTPNGVFERSIHWVGGPYGDDFPQPEGPFDHRTEWWLGDSSPRFRPPTAHETAALLAKQRAHAQGRISDLELDRSRAQILRARLLNPDPDDPAWAFRELRTVLKRPEAYDVNGCLEGSACADRHGGWHPASP